MLVMALPYMDDAYAQRLEELTREYRESVREHEQENPFGVPITRGGWAGAGTVISFGITNYWLHQALDRKSTRLNSSHVAISYAVFCLKKKINKHKPMTSD